MTVNKLGRGVDLQCLDPEICLSSAVAAAVDAAAP